VEEETMKSVYSCTAAILVILAGAALYPTHMMKAGPGSATQATAVAPAATPTQKQNTRLAENYGKLPLSFEANQGQTASQVKFLSRGRGYSLFLTGSEAVLALPSKAPQRPPAAATGLPGHLPSLGAMGTPEKELERPEERRAVPALPSSSAGLAASGASSTVLRMRLVGASASAVVTGANELPGKSNYFMGNDPKKWRTNVPTYAQVKYAGVYPGVDLVYYGNQGGQLEYDFLVAPGADPAAIRLALSGDLEVGGGQSAVGSGSPSRTQLQSKIQNLKSKIDASGDLVIKTDGGEVRFHKPVVYQEQFTIDSSQLTVQDEKQHTTDNPKSKIENSSTAISSCKRTIRLVSKSHTKTAPGPS
jgi:hypothetical protein